jgi:hypothetical protein
MNRITTLAALGAACAALAACGGGNSTPPAPAPAPAPQSFSYVAPALGATDTWSRVLTDSVGTGVAMQVRLRVTQVNADGSQVWTYDDPTGVDVVQDNLAFRTVPEVIDISATGGTLDYTATRADGTQVTCTYGPGATATAAANAGRVTELAARRAQDITIGQTYTSTYAITCAGQAPVTYHATAYVIGYESVTVPAGSFQAVKETVSLTYTDNGVDGIVTTTLWRDPANSMLSVKSDQAVFRSGATTAYLTRDQRELLSRQ